MMKFLLRPIDSAILILFRALAGLLFASELILEIQQGKLIKLAVPYDSPTEIPLPWIKAWPYWGMVGHYSLTIFAALAVAFNYHYRLFSKVLFAGLTLLYLFHRPHTISLYCLITFWMMVLPLDEQKNSHPAWMLYLFLFTFTLVYVSSGITELTGMEMDMFLHEKSDSVLSACFNYSWLFFDLLIIPLLLIRRTKGFALIASIIFQIFSMRKFDLGIFPWFSLLFTTMFFNPSWPRKIPIIRKFMPWKLEIAPVYHATKTGVAVGILYILMLLLLPLKSHLDPRIRPVKEEKISRLTTDWQFF